MRRALSSSATTSPSPRLPKAFSGFTILQLSDLHVDMSQEAMRQLETLVAPLKYDVCVITGDFRGRLFGPYLDTRAARVDYRGASDLYGVLGNHDTAAMVPGLEKQGVCMLLNESVAIARGSDRINIAGIDDTHFVEAAASIGAAAMPRDEFSVLISHTSSPTRKERAGFDVMLSGHTHGGQICLPGGIPITLDAKLPRRLGRGAWRYGKLRCSVGAGSSVVPVRFNCPPEITLHHLEHLS